VLPVSEKAADYAGRVADRCRQGGLRADADLRNEKLNYKIREAQLMKIPVMAVVGEREAQAGTVAPRVGGQNQDAIAMETFVQQLGERARLPAGGVA
jgi:threonyl-tRNA synthetase